MKKIFLISIVSMLCFFKNTVYAQFYDEDDEIYFYQRVDADNNTYVFNFNGTKATTFGFHTTLGVKNKLKENRNYYEGQVYGAKYDVKYRDDLSSSTWTVYSRYEQGIYGMPSFTIYWYFSKDRKTMRLKDSRNTFEYRLVDKDYYIDGGRRRSNTNSGVIYE